MKEKTPFVMCFDGSVQGLNIGAPVIFRGVQVEEVTQIVALYDPQEVTIRIKVVAEFVQGSLGIGGQLPRDPQQAMQAMEGLIQKGVRASLQMQSIVTGLLYVALDFHPDTPIKRLGLDPTCPELPTVPFQIEQLTASIRQAVADLGKLPLEALLGELMGVFQRHHPGLTGVEACPRVFRRYGDRCPATVAECRWTGHPAGRQAGGDSRCGQQGAGDRVTWNYVLAVLERRLVETGAAGTPAGVFDLDNDLASMFMLCFQLDFWAARRALQA